MEATCPTPTIFKFVMWLSILFYSGKGCQRGEPCQRVGILNSQLGSTVPNCSKVHSWLASSFCFFFPSYPIAFSTSFSFSLSWALSSLSGLWVPLSVWELPLHICSCSVYQKFLNLGTICFYILRCVLCLYL